MEITEEIHQTVCKSKVCCIPSSKPVQETYNGKILTFCEEACRIEFLENPESFLASDHFLVEFETLPDKEE